MLFPELRQGQNAVIGARVGAEMDRQSGVTSWGKDEEEKSEVCI